MDLGQCLLSAWQTFKRYAGAFMLVGLTLLAAELLAYGLLVLAFEQVGAVVALVLTGMFWAGNVVAAQAALRGERPSLKDAFTPFVRSPATFLLVGIAMYCGLLLCGVGVFATCVLFLFAPVLVAEGAELKKALLQSKTLALANLGPVALLCLVMAAFNSVGMLACGIGLAITMPFSAVMVVTAYEQARAKAGQAPTVECPV
jgi:hypothetical protein